MRQPVFACLLMAALVACSEPADKPDSPVPAPTSVTPSQTVVLHEGTNLAFAADKTSDTLVLALQGLLFRTSLAGGEASLLLGPEMDAREPVLGNGGKTVVFQGYGAGNWDLYELDLAGGSPYHSPVTRGMTVSRT